MSIIGEPKYNLETKEFTLDELKLDIDSQLGIVKNDQVEYAPSKEERAVRAMILQHFQQGTTVMYTPRVEFSDLPVIYRDQVDWMAFNTYQPNNGNNAPGDEINGWRSNAIRPVVRNQCISIAAHVTARLIFPKIFAENSTNDDDKDAAEVMMDLMQWRGEQVNYAETSLKAVIQAEVAPLSIVHIEFAEVYRKVKRERDEQGKWKEEHILDETLSGFKDSIVPVDQFIFPNFFEPNVQKQDWVIWRRVQSHSLLKGIYQRCPNWKYVKPGMQVLFNDANQTFYYVYDPSMRGMLDEQIIYWNRALDLKIEIVNGVMMTPYDNPNPRWDKLYPFATFGYEEINARCAYFKSLAFKLQHDANILNQLYSIIIDGSFLNVMQPVAIAGAEMINSGVIVPGGVTTFSSPDAKVFPIKPASDLQSGLLVMQQVEKSISDSGIQPIEHSAQREAAYVISAKIQQQQFQLGIFKQMVGSFVKQYGTLAQGDILQYLTVPEAADITGDAELTYKTFLLRNKNTGGKNKTRKIKFDASLPMRNISENDHLNLSYNTLEKGGGLEADTELYRVNPEIFRNLKFRTVVSGDVMNPLSEDAERQYGLEDYDRIIQSPYGNQEEALRELILGKNPITKKNVDKFIKKPDETQQMAGQPNQPGQPGQGPTPAVPQPMGAGSQMNLQQMVQGLPTH